jgi:hypothetical protein
VINREKYLARQRRYNANPIGRERHRRHYQEIRLDPDRLEARQGRQRDWWRLNH